jgi:hypothetical protein
MVAAYHVHVIQKFKFYLRIIMNYESVAPFIMGFNIGLLTMSLIYKSFMRKK